MDSLRFSTALALGALVLAGCGGSSSGSASGGTSSQTTAVVAWNNLALQSIRDTKPGPPMTARALAIVHTAIFNAWANYDAKASSTMSGATKKRPIFEFSDANKITAISFAAYRTLLDLYPSEKSLFDQQMASMGYDPTNTSEDLTSPLGIGNYEARILLEMRHADGSNQLNGYADNSGYVPNNTETVLNDPSLWQPVFYSDGNGGFTTKKYIGPHWGNVKPFALTSGSQFRPGPQPAFGSQACLDEVQEVVDLTGNLTDQQKAVAEYWADGPKSELPPGHWHLFAQYISKRDNLSLDDNVKLFFAVSNAVFDAGIAAWDAKRTYNSCRPITAIRYLHKNDTLPKWALPGGAARTQSGASWVPFQPATFITPPFPEYVSGHSAFSAAAAEVLKDFIGSDSFGASFTVPVGFSKVDPGTPSVPVTLSWPTFSAAADEAGISRRYGGIHFKSGDLAARTLGRQVGQAVWAKVQSYINGNPTP